MHPPSSLTGFGSSLWETMKKHAVLLFVLAILTSIALLTNRNLRAALPGVPDPDAESSRICTSADTLFEDVNNLDDATEIFKKRTSEIVEERLKLLQTPSEWTCPKDATEPESAPMPKLQALADELPGWSYDFESPLGLGRIRKSKPIRFELFSSVLMEFEREYECHLTMLQDNASALVVRNEDYPGEAEFCCAGEACSVVESTTVCNGAPTSDPLCGGACSPILTIPGFSNRLESLYERTAAERLRARIAVERTMMTLRSFEVNYGYARDLMCYARASLDLRNELSLLADTTSCMPKIWDALTSLHDRTP